MNLLKIQNELKAPKGNYSSYGGFKYRSCEDILEAVKPLLKEEGLTLTISDEMVMVGERYYIKATATIRDGEESISVSAYAREAESKKGMDESQITGTASSYARKYALNGLFLIDDTKDADTDEFRGKTATKTDENRGKKTINVPKTENQYLTEAHQKEIFALLDVNNIRYDQVFNKPITQVLDKHYDEMVKHLLDYVRDIDDLPEAMR